MSMQTTLSRWNVAAAWMAALMWATPAGAQLRVEPPPATETPDAGTPNADDTGDVPSEAAPVEEPSDANDANDANDDDANDDDANDDDTNDDDASDDDADEPAYDDPLFQNGSGSTESAAAGTVTILAGVATVATLAYVLERTNTVDVCAAYEAEPIPTRGCITTASIQTQRDVGIGLLVTAGTTLIAAAIAWVVVVVTRTDAPTAQRSGCGFDGDLRCRF